MATKQILKLHTAGKNLYFALLNSIAQLFDFADNKFKTLASHAIAGVTTGIAGASAFAVAGDVTSSLTVGDSLRVRGSTGNDAVYTIRSGSVFSSPNTTINVDEAVSDATVDGSIDLNATPFITATERTDGGGAGKSHYTGQIDLVSVNNTGTLGQYSVTAYERAGVDPVPLSDTVVSQPAALEVLFGKQGRKGDIEPGFSIATETTSGDPVELAAWLECDGEVLDLATIDPTATAEVVVVLFGTDSGTPKFTATTANFGSPNADKRFEYSLSSPNWTTDRQYSALVTITENGNTWTKTFTFTVFP